MAGFLGRLERKATGSGATRAAEGLLRPVSVPGAVGAADALSQVVEKAAAASDAASALKEMPRDANTRAGARSGDPRSARSARDKKKDSKGLDDSLPWWLNELYVSSPQVDALVPAARLALNDLIGDSVTPAQLAAAIKKAVGLAADRLAHEIRFSAKDLQDANDELVGLMLGKGPLQPLYDDPSVTDIYLDGHDSIKCVRRGQALETPFKFRSASEYEAYITSMLQSVERVLNLSSPIVDCVLGDACRSRINAVHSSLRDGKESSLVIRVPRLQQISFYDLLRTKTLPATLAAWLSELVSCGEANILVMGPTGSGKTTLTTALLSAVGSDERICTIEDVPEIFVPTTHLEKLVSRPENSQGEGHVGMDRLLRAALRRAPHRIVVGEIRDREGPLFLKALETGHAGSVATIHADNPRDGLWRLLDVVAAYEEAPQESLQRRIARSVHVLVALKKINGRPCLTEVAEVEPPQHGEFVVRTIVRFEAEVGGKRSWRICSQHSRWIDRLAQRGLELAAGPALLPYQEPPAAVTLVPEGAPPGTGEGGNDAGK